MFPLHKWWHCFVKSQGINSASVYFWKQAAFPGQHQFQNQQSSQSQVEVYSSCFTNSVFKQLLHRSLHKSSRAHLMKGYDPGLRRFTYKLWQSRRLWVDAVIYFHLVFAVAEGSFLYLPPQAQCINSILQTRDAGCIPRGTYFSWMWSLFII